MRSANQELDTSRDTSSSLELFDWPHSGSPGRASTLSPERAPEHKLATTAEKVIVDRMTRKLVPMSSANGLKKRKGPELTWTQQSDYSVSETDSETSLSTYHSQLSSGDEASPPSPRFGEDAAVGCSKFTFCGVELEPAKHVLCTTCGVTTFTLWPASHLYGSTDTPENPCCSLTNSIQQTV